jgi:hypothetical protein
MLSNRLNTAGIMPGPAAFLGYAGLAPFVLGALGSWVLPLQLATYAASLQIYYAAIILSFLGAVHWGWAVQRDFEAPTTGWAPYIWSTLPAVLSWLIVAVSVFPKPGQGGATLLELDQTVSLLMALFLLAMVVDLRANRNGHLPGWYIRLRLHLTTGALVCLGLTLWRILSHG